MLVSIELQDKDQTYVLDVYATAKLSSSKELWVDGVVIGDKLPSSETFHALLTYSSPGQVFLGQCLHEVTMFYYQLSSLSAKLQSWGFHYL